MTESKVPTPDGERIRVNQLNIGIETQDETGLLPRIARVFRGISLFLAGMYTGIGCAGTPNRYHEYNPERDDGPL